MSLVWQFLEEVTNLIDRRFEKLFAAALTRRTTEKNMCQCSEAKPSQTEHKRLVSVA